MIRRSAPIFAIVFALALSNAVENSRGEPLPTGVKTSNPTVYKITMTTTFVTPANGKVDQVRVYHALPTLRSWSESKAKFGATELGSLPKSAKAENHPATDSHYLIWTVNGVQKPGAKSSFTTTMTVTSADRDFDPAAAKVTWKKYATPPKDKSAAVDPAAAKMVHPELAKVAAKFKADLAPAEAVREMCKWIVDNIKYDASVPYPTTDVDSIVRKKCGHCGHQAKVIEQLTAAAGIPTRAAWGMNLYAPDGRTSELQAIRPDFTNVHTWAEVYFPDVGWIEVDPALGAKAFSLPAHQIQSNRWFQNYAVWYRDDGVDKMPKWTVDGGKFRSDCGLENTIAYVKKATR